MVTPALPPVEEDHLFVANDVCLPPLETSTSIRLIDLELGEYDSNIAMSMNIYNLSDPPQYVALSYTWGDPLVHPYVAERPSRTVWIDAKPFLVTPNLYDALNHWRGWKLEIGTAKTLLWVDAICIKQDDLIERNHQVGLMSQIYSKAALVLAWVGISDEDAWTALKLVSRLQPIVKLWQSEKSKFTYFHNSDELFERVSVSKVRPAEWKALISFYERQYFSRVWIVQEIVLAKALILMFGNYFIHWDELVDLSQMMVSCSWIPILERYARPGIDTERPGLTLGAPGMYNHVKFRCQQYGSSKRGQLQLPAAHSGARTFYHLLELLLYETRYFRATNPRDNVYAVLSIVSHVFGATTDLLRPDYSLPINQVFINVTGEIATKTGSTSVLSLSDYDSKRIHGLPSWVPDYSASNIEPLAYVCGAKLYHAFNLTRRSPEPTIMGSRLLLCAMRWDTITATQTTGHPFPLQGQMDLCLQLPEIYPNSQSRVEALWRTLIGDTNGERSPAPESIGNSFRQYVLLAIATRLRKVLEGWDGSKLILPDFESLIKLSDNCDECPIPWLPRKDEIALFWDMFQTMLQSTPKNERTIRELEQGAHLYTAAIENIGRGRLLFKTAGNLLGLAPVSAKRGDAIWFLPSSRVPFILRHDCGKRYKLIGEAYLHGYMQSELERYSGPLQHISLI